MDEGGLKGTDKMPKHGQIVPARVCGYKVLGKLLAIQWRERTA